MFRVCWLIGLVVISGCNYDPFDPYQRPGTWNPDGANQSNLRAMVANPHDIIEGTGQSVSSGAEAAPPVARVLAGKRYPLPNLNAATIDVFSQQPPQQGTNPVGTAP
jgi:hypothetical protein